MARYRDGAVRAVAERVALLAGTPSQDVVAMAAAGPEGHEAALRPQEDAPFRPATPDW
jgi:hypothetical protein